MKTHADQAAVRALLSDNHPRRRGPMVAVCLAAVSDATGLPTDRILNGGRERLYVRARWLVMWLARTTGAHGYGQIARVLRLKDHSTITYGVRQIEALRNGAPEYRALCDQLSRRVSPPN